MTSELPHKLAKLGATYDAITRMRKALAECPPGERIQTAIALQRLKNEAAELRSLLPKPKLVVNNA